MKSTSLDNRNLPIMICAAAAAISLALNWNTAIHPIPGAYDAERYLDMAQNIVDGRWLGAYNHLTLIRLPFYSLFLVLNSMMGWPLHFTQQVLSLLSYAVLSLALRQNHIPRWCCVCIFILCTLHPVTFVLSEFIATETLYTPVTTIIFAACLGLYGNFRGRSGWFVFWLLLLSLFMSMFYVIRDEGIWIGGLLAGLSLLIYLHFTDRSKYVKICIILFLPMLSVGLVNGLIADTNERAYGLHATSDLDEPNFKAALNWLSRVAPESHRPHIPFTNEALRTAFLISPSFQELQPSLESQLDNGPWLRCGCDWMGECEELCGACAVWAIREAAAIAGHYASANSARDFYVTVYEDIRGACRQQAVPCTQNPTATILTPPLRLTYIPSILFSIPRWFSHQLSFDGLAEALHSFYDLEVNENLRLRYDAITHDQQNLGSMYMRYNFVDTNIKLFTAIQWLGCGVLVLCLVAEAIYHHSVHTLTFADFLKTHWIMFLVTIVLFVRIALVGYIDVMSFRAHIRYLLCLYPVLMVPVGFGLTRYPGDWLKRRRTLQ